MRTTLAFAAATLCLAASAAEPVAFVADLRGNASIEGDGRVNFLAQLNAGTRLLLGTGATMAVTYAASGAEFTLRGPGEFVVTGSEVKADKGAAPTKRVVVPLQDSGVVARIGNTATASVRMRNVQPSPRPASLEYPVDTKVTTIQPVLRWTHEAGEGAEVTLVDAKGKEVWRGPAPAGSVQPPVKLSAATRYRWTVMTAKGPVGEAQFETLPADALGRASKSRAAAKSFSDRVMHALMLHELGANQEAREAWIALSRERPDLPELAALAR